MAEPLKIAVIGGGIGGLSSAVALAGIGHSVTVYEQAADISPMGSCLSLWPNAMQCLADWGLAAGLQENGAVLSRLSARRLDGRPYFSADLSEIYEEFSANGICVRRSDLQSALLQALDADQIRFGRRLVDLKQDGQTVELTFENGTRETADLVIGADGLRSKTRDIVLKDGPPRYAGYGAWLGIADAFPSTIKQDEICEYYGSHGRFGVAPTGAGHAYWFYVENNPEPRQAAGPIETVGLMDALRQWPEFARDLVRNTPEDAVIYAPFFDRPATRNWGKGRVLLLGDAVHPFTPNLGQGACQSIEDAHVLAQLLRRNTAPEDLLSAYQKARAKRANMFAKQSRQIGMVTQMTSPGLRWLRGLLLMSARDRQWRRSLRQHFTRPAL